MVGIYTGKSKQKTSTRAGIDGPDAKLYPNPIIQNISEISARFHCIYAHIIAYLYRRFVLISSVLVYIGYDQHHHHHHHLIPRV